METTKQAWTALQRIAVSLTESLGAHDRYQRLLDVVRTVVPCDAIALLALQGGVLVPLATCGLVPQVMGMRFVAADHPRLAAALRSTGPVRFPAGSPLPDPFDKLVAGDRPLGSVHDCLGCPLVADGEVVGLLTADALDAGRFDALDDALLGAIGALAGASLRTARLIETIESLAEQRGRVVKELTRGCGDLGASPMLGRGPAMTAVRHEIDAVAATDFAVLVLGETGVGKELAARELHQGSRRRDAPFIQVNCAALPEGVIESELFGHVRGAFTGAVANRPGKFELADGGTLFLDEIGELPVAVQAKLLRVLQSGEVQRVGADEVVRVDVRIVAATNRELAAEIAAGRFRADLYHRLAVFPLRIPPLRERREDIALLAGFFADRYRAQLGLPPVVLAPGAIAALEGAGWPGNVRELDHVLARALLRGAGRAVRGHALVIEAADLDPPSAAPAASPAAASAAVPGPALTDRIVAGELPLREAVDELKRAAITEALASTGGSWALAARRLGLDRSNLHHLARRLGVAAAER